MNEDLVQEKRILRERFWFLIAFSAFLIFVFAIYLPDRFTWQATSGVHDDEAMDEHPEDGAMHEETLHGGGYESHEEKDILQGLSVNLTATPTPIRVGSPVELDFFVNEKPNGTPIASSDLQVEHERLMHVIGVRSDMNEFFHIHPYPTSTPGVFTVQGKFSKPGLYKIWSEVKKDGIIHATGHREISTEGIGPRSEKTISFERNVIAGNYEVNLDMEEPVVQGREHELSFDIHTRTGEEVEVENYLGAPMHLTIIRDDWKEFLHTHPEDNEAHMPFQFIPDARAHGENEDPESSQPTSDDKAINFHVMFPEAGFYKAFAQFRPQGTDLPPDLALKAEFWIRVEEQTNTKTGLSDWWILLISSGIAIVVLSFAVKKFITVKPAPAK